MIKTHRAARDFWQEQTSSLHRSDDPSFYEKKAKDHLSFMNPEDTALPAIDLGCGAGELLAELHPHMNVVAGLDYSTRMLEMARARVPGLDYIDEDLLDYLPGCDHPIWMATGSINQYFDAEGQRRILDIFMANEACRKLYFFDNVDPIRYLLANKVHQIDYTSGAPRSRLRLAYAVSRLAWLGLFSFRSLDNLRLESHMGYGISPRFWVAECAERGLDVEVGSSRQYEYRYHLAIAKHG